MGELEVVKKAIAGDDESFLLVMQQYKESLYRTALAFLKNEQDALEAMQEITYRAYKKIHTLKEPAYMKTWLTRIMMNYCQDQLKKRNRFTNNELLEQEVVTNQIEQLELTEALKTLNAKDQQLVYLKYFQDVKIKDIPSLKIFPKEQLNLDSIKS